MERYTLYSVVRNDEEHLSYVKSYKAVQGAVDDFNGVVTTESGELYTEDKVSISDGNGYYITRAIMSEEEAYGIVISALISHFEAEASIAQSCIKELNNLK